VASDALSFVDLDRFPLNQSDSEAYHECVEGARSSLSDDGCCVLQGLINEDALNDTAAETRNLASYAYFAGSRATVYGGSPDMSLPSEDPRRVEVQRDNGFVAGDRIPAETRIRQLYHAPAFRNFIGACVGFEDIYEFADPLAQLVVNVLPPASGHGWHFDTNEFIVTLLTQPSDDGGRFEYCPQIRSAKNEHYDDVGGVLADNTKLVRGLDIRTGDLQIFYGRYSLHRVTPVEGTRDRHTVIFAYTERPDLYGDPEKTRQIFGRTTGAHEGAN
jgi:hypothetical protein